MSSAPHNAGRSATLDLYRGIACGMILVYHLPDYSSPVGLGQAAMELFFVLSGYLISKSLAKSVESCGARGVVYFWFRRVRRLMPGMAGFVLGAIVLNVGLAASSPRELGWGSVAALLGWYNFYQFIETPGLIGFGGIWSLSLEEQFYALAVIVVLASRALLARPVAWIFVLAAALLGTGFVFRWLAVSGFYRPPLDVLAYLPPLRLWGFGVGVLVVAMEMKEGIRNKLGPAKAAWIALSCVVLVAVLVATVRRYDARAFSFQWALIPVLGGLVVYLWPLLEDGLLAFRARATTWPGPMRGACGGVLKAGLLVGKASYSIYLWHCLVIAAFVEMGWDGGTKGWLAMAALSLLCGFLSWHFVEKRFYRFS